MSKLIPLTHLEAQNLADARAFGKPFKMRLSSRDICLLALDGKRCPGLKPHTCLPPYTPHMSMFTRNGKPAVIVMQPYLADEDQIDAITWYCLKNGFEVEQGALGGKPVQSFWSPNCVVLSIYRPGEFE